MCNFIRASLKAYQQRNYTVDYRIPRYWSNVELKKFAPLFSGTVLNVSAENDSTKTDGVYKDYFSLSSSYITSNYFTDRLPRESELYIDLENEIDSSLHNIADVVFNHTTLEHVFNCHIAFRNLCLLSKDVVIVVVPFIQKMHGGKMYNDYWRFTPEAMKRLYQNNGLHLQYCSDNATAYASTYLFCIGYKDKKWDNIVPRRLDNMMHETETKLIGGNLFKNNIFNKIKYFLNNK